MAADKYAGTVTVIVKGVKIVDTPSPAQLPGLEGLPAGTVAVEAVALTDPASARFGEYAVKQLPLSADGSLPAGAVAVEVVSFPELKPVFDDGMAVEVLDVTALPTARVNSKNSASGSRRSRRVSAGKTESWESASR